MNRLLSCLILIGVLAGLWALPAAPVHAQTSEPVGENIVSFARLGVREQNLRGPFDSAQLDFSVPANWELTDGAELQLNLATFFAGQSNAGAADGAAGQAGRMFGGTLQVVFNDVTVQTILLDQIGERTVSVPIPASALTSTRRDGRHYLNLLLDTDEQCGLEQYTSLIIRASSQFVLPHRIVAPPTALALLPRPIVQRSFLPDTATIVVPDNPTPGEIQAALTIAAGLGRMADSAFQLALQPVSRAQADTLKRTHLILVGKIESLPLRDDLRLPARVDATSVADDGVIQMAVSPWNDAQVALVVSGQSDAAVIKAAQAFSTGTLRGGEQPNMALVAAVQPQPVAAAANVDRSFAELGYEVQRLYGQGAQYAAYRFELPVGQVISGEAHLDLSFVHTALLDYDQSGMTVSLNDEPIASIRLDDNSTRLSSTRVALPASAVRAGSNLLVLRADLLPRAICTDPRGNGLWLTVRPESILHLPLSPATGEATTHTIDLKRYPAPFTVSPNLERTALIVAEDDPRSWSIATAIAFDLGRQMQGTLVDLAAAFGSAVPPQVRQERDLLIVGRPSALTIVGELGAALPAPFAAGSDLAAEPNAPVVYRRSQGEHVGYLQLLAAPWSKERAVLAVLGSTDQGLGWAGAALTTPRLRSQLS
ncbi:MAG TPA: cellulose biosynthesis cyclic di-GMP-binding regulatory protein BcsB, partial [Herpetosiphonaceae bacterium]